MTMPRRRAVPGVPALDGAVPVGPGPADAYLAATEALRATTRWLVTAAAGVGAVLVAGLQLTGLGSLGAQEMPRLVAAFGGLVVALTGVGYMVLRASQILTTEWVTLADIEKDIFDHRVRQSAQRSDGGARPRLRDRVARPRDRRYRLRAAMIEGLKERLEFIAEELFGSLATSVPDLYAQLADANEAARGAPDSAPARSAAALQQAAVTVVAFANFYITKEWFKVLRRQLAAASAVVIAGVLVFAYAANPPKPAEVAGERPAAAAGR
ncbi:hypothetical protein [Couchioplanes azureus]|uniref:hypothetical protein n=1 Tax=Couchioplanes caeruleus TaxID=56438 RepID=UPI00166FE6D5|nr:hypothetical protein [Couchioplanes caeruleus]GGQ87830.1 hypothetical protein GCM10010166_67440 [Couchioplanes caeruleus subsp. azureus]